MITIERITGKFLHYYGLGSTRSNLDIRPIFPYLLMDAGYQFYDKQLFKRKKNHVFKHEVAKHVGNLGTAFHEYFQTLFVVFGERSDERDEIIDMMDRYGKFMEHDLQILLYSSMDCFMNDFGMEEETVLGSTLVLNSLADISRGIWMDAVADDLKNGRCDEKALLIANRIDAVLAKSKEFSFSYMKLRHKEETFVDEAMHRKLTMAVDAFANGTIRWIRQEAEYQRQRETEQIKDYGL